MDPIDRQRAARAKLSELSGAVRAYFDTTLTSSGGAWAAFDALRKNAPLAEAFVHDLVALLEHVDHDVLPLLGGPAVAPARAGRADETTRPVSKQHEAVVNAPAKAASGAQRPVSINDDETMLLSRLPENVLEGLPAKPAPAKEPARPAPAPVAKAPPKVQVDDGDDSLIQELVTDPDVNFAGKFEEARQPGKPAAAREPIKPAAAKEPMKAAPAKEPAKPAATKEASKPAPAKEPPKPAQAQAVPKPAPAQAAPKPAAPAKPLPGMAPAAKPQGGGLAARIAAVTQAQEPVKTPEAAKPAPAAPAAKPAPAPAKPAPAAPPKPAPAAPAARPAPAPAASKPAARPVPSRHRTPAPQFDESDLDADSTNPGFTMDEKPPAKRR